MREQTSILKLFDLIARTVDKPDKFIQFLLQYLSDTDLKIEKYEGVVKICEDSRCTRYVVITYNPTIEIFSTSRKISKLIIDIALKYLATSGEKKLVLLYMNIGDGRYVKLTKILRHRSDSFYIISSKLWNFIIALIAIFVAFLSSIVFKDLLLTMVFVVMSSIFMSTLSLLNVYKSSRGIDIFSRDILKICISCRWDTPESRIRSLLRILKNFDEISRDTVHTIDAISRIVLGEYYQNFNIDNISLDINVVNLLDKLKTKVLLVNSDYCNAFTLPIFRRIIITTKLLAVLNNQEISAVIAHEIGHIVNNDFIKSLILFILNSFIIYLIVRYMISTFMSIILILSTMLLYISISILLFFAIFRKFEIYADKYAEKIVGSDSLVNALIKVGWKSLILEIDKPIMLMLARIISTHPPILDRVLRVV